MDKLSEYIPIIIILISLVFTVIGKKKKAENVAHETASPWQIEEEVIVEKPKKQILRKPESKPVNKFTDTSTTPIIPEPEEEENSPFSFEEEDDVVRAIIYSEIINRKEY